MLSILGSITINIFATLFIFGIAKSKDSVLPLIPNKVYL